MLVETSQADLHLSMQSSRVKLLGQERLLPRVMKELVDVIEEQAW